jgi:flagellar basal-body rod modification protein FlgD
MPVDATSSVTANTAANIASGSTIPRQLKKQLDSDDFMKLLAVQFQSQDPMKPMEDTAFISQMAQFSSLSQSNSLVTQMGLLRADQQNASATGMLGRTVTTTDAKGNIHTGQVSAVVNTDAGPALVIDGKNYSLSTVTRVENTAPAPADLPPAA